MEFQKIREYLVKGFTKGVQFEFLWFVPSKILVLRETPNNVRLTILLLFWINSVIK